MTMPKKKRRDLRVAGESYHYMVKRRDGTYKITIQNVETQKLKSVTFETHKWFRVKPGHVKAMVLAGDDDNWENYLVRQTCNCGEGIAEPVKSICVFDAEIKPDYPPHYCRCCEKCRNECAMNI